MTAVDHIARATGLLEQADAAFCTSGAGQVERDHFIGQATALAQAHASLAAAILAAAAVPTTTVTIV